MEYVTAEGLARINKEIGCDGFRGADRGGIEGAAHRPMSSFGGEQAFTTVWLKAGALLHGVARSQYSLDGNKRTGWLASVLFLRMNGVHLPRVHDVQAEAFVLAVAVAETFGVEKAAEWFEVTADSAGG